MLKPLLCKQKITSKSDSVEEKWLNVKAALKATADSTLGYEKRRNPDGFRESVDTLEPLLQKRNQMYSKWLCSGHNSDKLQFLNPRRAGRQAVRAAKNTWFQNKVKEAQKVRFWGKKVRQCIRDMQKGRRGLVPTRIAMVRDEDGTPCTTTLSQHQRWMRHFTYILNICSHFSLGELEKVKQRPIRASMANPSTMEEMRHAVSRLKSGKAGATSGILPEMLRASCCDDEFSQILLDLMHSVWKERQVPQDWLYAVLVPIPKKGDLTMCYNWRGISLLCGREGNSQDTSGKATRTG